VLSGDPQNGPDLNLELTSPAPERHATDAKSSCGFLETPRRFDGGNDLLTARSQNFDTLDPLHVS
jgi:hypothetical protein